MTDELQREAQQYFESLQTRICDALASEDGGGAFKSDRWERAGGGGGLSRVLAGGRMG